MSRTVLAIVLVCALYLPVHAGQQAQWRPVALSGDLVVTPAAIVGKDQRVPKIPQKYRQSADAVGALWTGKALCSAACVADNVVVTSAHCLVNRRGRVDDSVAGYVFVWRTAGRTARAHVAGSDTAHQRHNVLLGGGYRGHAEHRDWAAVKLSKPVCAGRVLKYREARRTRKKLSIFNIAFHEDSKGRLLYSGHCKSRRRIGGRHAKRFTHTLAHRPTVLLHTCDTRQGSSGSPILASWDGGKPFLLAVNQGTVVWSVRRGRKRVGSGRVNIAVRASSFADRLDRFIDETPLAGDLSILAVQEYLARAGLYKGAIDGLIGPRTRRAIGKVEKRLKIKRLGIPTVQLLDKLRQEYPDPQEALLTTNKGKTRREENRLWLAAHNDPDRRAYDRYLQRWPDGRFAPLAKWRLEAASAVARLPAQARTTASQ